MRLERLNADKIKIFLTFDDLSERGISKDEIWQDIPKVHQLFRDMMLEANDELGFKADGPIAVEVFSLPAQGMVVIVSKSTDADFEEDDEDYIEMQVTVDESSEIFYEFASFEDVLSLSGRLHTLEVNGGTLYSYGNCFYLHFGEAEMESFEYEGFIALLSEFGSPSTITSHRVQEYGKVLMETEAVGRLYHTFLQS
ncbi:MAG TPA: genetic competence negative regulator [Bacillales bacterium]|nr:genetic competence negative regulator [Bacillales bacterium]